MLLRLLFVCALPFVFWLAASLCLALFDGGGVRGVRGVRGGGVRGERREEREGGWERVERRDSGKGYGEMGELTRKKDGSLGKRRGESGKE